MTQIQTDAVSFLSVCVCVCVTAWAVIRRQPAWKDWQTEGKMWGWAEEKKGGDEGETKLSPLTN